MNWAFDLGSIFGIRIRIHYLFLLFIGFLVVRQGMADMDQHTFQAPWLLLFLLLLFAFVFLHELGHSVVAMRFGIPVKDITLWPLGGIARLGRIPEEPRVELAISIAGPAVNLALVAVLLPLALVVTPANLDELLRLGPRTILANCVVVNLFMAGFNFIPAFPMDGGRVLRSLLGYRMDFVTATRKAVRVGRFFAFAFILVGILYFSQLAMLILIGVFVLVVGAQEERAVRWRAILRQLGEASPVIDEDGNPVAPDDRGGGDMDEALRDALARGDLDALRRALSASLGRERPPSEPRDGAPDEPFR